MAQDKENCSALVVDNPYVNPSPSALMIPVIIDRIFGYLTVSKVKDARRVCKIWESVGTACLGRRCFLSINKFCQDDDTKFASTPIKDQLVRSVQIEYSLDSNGFTRTVDIRKRIDYEFVKFVSKYHERIEWIQFDVDRHFAPTIQWVLENVKFSKLKTIILNEHDHSIQSILGCGLNFFDNLNFLLMPTMTTLGIFASEYMDGRGGTFRVDEKDGFPYYQIVQEIIKKSPNLDKLEINENFYPDLSCCRKLKVLKCEGYPFKPFPDEDDDDDEMGAQNGEQQIEIREDFSLPKMLNMMDQVKHTLEELVIGTAGEYCKNKIAIPVLPGHSNIKFPCFPRLRSFSVDPIDVYMLGFQKVIPQNELPILRKLTLQELDKEKGYLNDVLLTMKTCWTNVEHLSLTGLQYERDDPSVLMNKIVKTFPNTTEFIVRIKSAAATDANPKILQRFKDALMTIAIADWNIQHFEMRIEFSISMSKLMDALGEVVLSEGFKRLKTLKISSSSCNVLDTGCENFETPFMALRNITFEGITFQGTTLLNMLKFIQRHDLNIYFFNMN